jgi:hypothetical protein
MARHARTRAARPSYGTPRLVKKKREKAQKNSTVRLMARRAADSPPSVRLIARRDARGLSVVRLIARRDARTLGRPSYCTRRHLGFLLNRLAATRLVCPFLWCGWRRFTTEKQKSKRKERKVSQFVALLSPSYSFRIILFQVCEKSFQACVTVCVPRCNHLFRCKRDVRRVFNAPRVAHGDISARDECVLCLF